MPDSTPFLQRLAKVCFATALTALVAMAGLTSAAYYASTFGHWSLIEPVGFVVLALAALMCSAFLVGFALHTVNVLLHARRPLAERSFPGMPAKEPVPVRKA